MEILIKKTGKVFLFTFISCTSLFILYGLILDFSLDILEYKHIILYALFFIFSVGFILSIFFNKSKVFLAQLVLLLHLFLIRFFLKSINNSVYYPDLSIFILLFNIMIISFYKERGIFTSRGFRRILFILIQFYLISFQNQIYIDLVNFIKLSITNRSTFIYILLLLFFFSLINIIKNLTSNEDYAFLLILIHIFVLFFYLENNYGFFITLFTFLSVLFFDIAIIKDFYSMAYLDELTGLPGRRALREEVLKLGNDYSIAMIDIDFFKKFNDKYGHDVGDQVLQMVATMMKKTKGGGKAFRYGGEEFTILFSGIGAEEAYHYLDELRENIANRPFTIRNRKKRKRKNKWKKKKSSETVEKVHITVSIGVAERLDIHNNPGEVIKKADKALYKAKKKGRNCVKL